MWKNKIWNTSAMQQDDQGSTANMGTFSVFATTPILCYVMLFDIDTSSKNIRYEHKCILSIYRLLQVLLLSLLLLFIKTKIVD
jgi:hypothetical protein